ncbi:uncharacterized protein DNG_01831 [Cephalotrichum gorgonifer]|uniref:TeaA receptor TeaR n=1 Tax=Cephalotrichum gorgonifer TaxID=2041049 RepID=A0AAE8MSH6_9PEZI|nr:uncharacterized protein DNG_01831 [Cephalotrichum gorgonifer]
MAAVSAANPHSAAAPTLNDDHEWDYDDVHRTESAPIMPSLLRGKIFNIMQLPQVNYAIANRWTHGDMQISKREKPSVFSETVNGDYAYAAEAEVSDQAPYVPNSDPTTRSHAANGNSHSWKSTNRPYEDSRGPASHAPGYDGRMNGGYHEDGVTEQVPSGRNGAAASRRGTVDSKHSRAEFGPDDSSKWIHRDKLAQIESEELQAAGFILPKRRSHSRVRKDNRYQDQSAHPSTIDEPASEQYATSGSRMSSNSTNPNFADSETTPLWDLRLPDEIAASENVGFTMPNGLSKGGTRIPVAKVSPAPIPLDYLERPTPVSRKHTGDGITKDAESIAYPKPRSRSASVKLLDAASTGPIPAKRTTSDVSPKKPTASAPGNRKPSSRGPSGSGRPKTRSGANKDSVSSNGGTRPSTRSGDLGPGSNSSRQPEGDPPWLLSAYRPDPRLPPDQQLLPTVARRLQQERWEKEGKFGNVLDKEFRPLTDDGFLAPPDAQDEPIDEPEPKSPSTHSGQPDGWPLKVDVSRSQTPKPNAYSTMPRIQDMHSQPSPLTPGIQQQRPLSPAVVKAPERPEQRVSEKQQNEGCGCCVVM